MNTYRMFGWRISLADEPAEQTQTQALTTRSNLSVTEMPEKFFSTLSQDEIRRILYYTDKLDHCCDGPDARYRLAMLTSVRAIDAENLASLIFSADGPFRCVTSNMFTTIHLDFEQKLNCIISRGIIAFGHNETVALLEPILEACGRHITEIHVRVARFDYYRVSVPLLLKWCKSVKKIRISVVPNASKIPDCVTSLIQGYSTEVESIEFADQQRMAIRVMEVSRVLPVCTILKSFHYSYSTLHHLIPVWRCVGETLEEIHLRSRGQTLWSLVIANLEQYCYRLSVIKLLVSNDDKFSIEIEQQFTSFFASYGNQLRIAEVSCLGFRSREQLLADCRNVGCVVKESLHRFDDFRILGDSLIELDLRLSDVVDWDSLSHAMRNCINLTKLRVSNLLCADVGSFLIPVEMRELHVLELKSVPSNVMLSLFADKTPFLKILRIKDIDIDGDGLSFVFRDLGSSLPELEQVSLTLRRKRRSGELQLDIAEETLMCFSNQKLRTFFIDFNAKAPDKMRLRSICVPYRNRGVRYTLCFQYYWLEFN